MGVVIPAGHSLVAHEIRMANDNESMFVTYGINLAPTDGQVAQQLHAIQGNILSDFMGSNFSVTKAIVTTPIAVFESTAAPFVGPNSANTVPSNTAVLVKKLSGLRGRSNRGRMYVPGVHEGDVNPNGTISAGVVTALQGFADLMLDGFSEVGGGCQMVILHDQTVSDPPTIVTELQVDPVVATQRRRMR